MKLTRDQQTLISSVLIRKAAGLRTEWHPHRISETRKQAEEIENLAGLIVTADIVEITHHEDGGAVGGE